MVSLYILQQTGPTRYVISLLYKNIVFPAEVNRSYFSADYKLKYSCENSKIISYDISVFKANPQALKSDMTHILNFALILLFLASFAVWRK